MKKQQLQPSRIMLLLISEYKRKRTITSCVFNLFLLFRRGEPERHEFTFETSIIETALSIGSTAKAAFKSRVRSDRGKGESRMATQQKTHFLVELFAFPAIAQTFAIWWITKERAILGIDLTLTCVVNSKTDTAIQAGLLQMAVGQFDSFRINI